jgi:CheY-like chemotaxis protein
LVAEDEAVVRNLIRLMRSKEGYAVLTANDGQEALQICRKQVQGPNPFAPNGRNDAANERLDLAQQVLSEIKIMIMSGDTILKENTPDAFGKSLSCRPRCLDACSGY